jgi:hypothetical protein
VQTQPSEGQSARTAGAPASASITASMAGRELVTMYGLAHGGIVGCHDAVLAAPRQVPASGKAEGVVKDAGGGGGASGRGVKGGKGGKGGKGKAGDGGGRGEGGATGEGEGKWAADGGGRVRRVLKAADMMQVDVFFKHCLEAFRGGLTVHTAIEHLVWSHRDGPAEVRAMATAFFVVNGRAIRVSVLGPVSVLVV